MQCEIQPKLIPPPGFTLSIWGSPWASLEPAQPISMWHLHSPHFPLLQLFLTLPRPWDSVTASTCWQRLGVSGRLHSFLHSSPYFLLHREFLTAMIFPKVLPAAISLGLSSHMLGPHTHQVELAANIHSPYFLSGSSWAFSLTLTSPGFACKLAKKQDRNSSFSTTQSIEVFFSTKEPFTSDVQAILPLKGRNLKLTK